MKVGVIRLSSLGDVILSSVVLQPLYENGYEVYFITFKPFDVLFKKDYRIKNIFSINKSEFKNKKNFNNFVSKIKEADIDLILDLHANFKSYKLTKALGVKTYRYNKKSIQRRLLLNPILKKFTKLENFNVIDAYKQPLEYLGIKNLEEYRPKIVLEESDKPDIDLPKHYITIGTGARYKGKMYPFYLEVVNLLLKRGFNIVLVGSKEDIINDNTVYPDQVLDLRGKLNIRQSLYVIRNSMLSISNDSAIAHMARAVGTKVIMIYGATHPYFGFYPLEDEGTFLFADLQCQPCDLHGKKECKFGDYRCFAPITPSLVLNSITDFLTVD